MAKSQQDLKVIIAYLQSWDDVLCRPGLDMGVSGETGFQVCVRCGRHVELAVAPSEVWLAIAGEGPVMLLTTPTILTRVGVASANRYFCKIINIGILFCRLDLALSANAYHYFQTKLRKSYKLSNVDYGQSTPAINVKIQVFPSMQINYFLSNWPEHIALSAAAWKFFLHPHLPRLS